MVHEINSPEETWIKVIPTDPPFYCGIHEKTQLKLYCLSMSSSINDDCDIFETFICQEEECQNKIIVKSFYKKHLKPQPIKNKKQKRLI